MALDDKAKANKMVAITLLSLGVNVPLGIWRASTKKFSIKWFAAIHLAVPLIYYLRITSHLSSWSIPILIGGAIVGQALGGIIYSRYLDKESSMIRG